MAANQKRTPLEECIIDIAIGANVIRPFILYYYKTKLRQIIKEEIVAEIREKANKEGMEFEDLVAWGEGYRCGIEAEKVRIRKENK